ncbi:UPF0149 family protein [Massilia sp. TW-1]|uniref:UPF0149 family protein n=1 Tax=Telluria antibiotica TaxID=2717319 RepID=A0ABX0P659_9BURK|nr:UPF0149 family protein [Telluria antibiotica]NIA52681.1 UPF0149 family protein [Telluria antibiotica]
MAQPETVTNIDDDIPLIYSPLNGTVSRNGRSVEVEIYRAENEEWILEVVDEHGNSTVWEGLFSTDQAALDEALRTIDEQGIDAVIGPPPGHDKRNAILLGLSDTELYELGDFLADPSIESTSMDLAMLDGYFAAIAIGPELVPVSEWLPWVWDHVDGVAEPVFDELSDANHVLSLLMRHYNAVVEAFNTDPAGFEPLFMRGAEYGAAEWSDGFLCGFRFDERAWSLLAVGQPTWFAPFMRLGTEDGIAITHKQGDAAQWVDAIMPSLLEIAAYWKSRLFMPGDMRTPTPPIVRATPKVGRNDPCPCGSGRKMKKCCGGTPMAPLTLH